MYLMVMQLVQQEQSVLRIRKDNPQENMLGQKVATLQQEDGVLMQKEIIQQHPVRVLMQKEVIQQHQEFSPTQKGITQQRQDRYHMQKEEEQQHKEKTNMSKVYIIQKIQQAPILQVTVVTITVDQTLILQTGKVTHGSLAMFILVLHQVQIKMQVVRYQLLENMQIVKHQLYKVMLLKICWMLQYIDYLIQIISLNLDFLDHQTQEFMIYDYHLRMFL